MNFRQVSRRVIASAMLDHLLLGDRRDVPYMSHAFFYYPRRRNFYLWRTIRCHEPTMWTHILHGGVSIPMTTFSKGKINAFSSISEWIHTSRGSCPTCRDLFLVIPEVPDDESSDGGEYIPGSDSVADDMMDGETWSDEDGEAWTDGEDMSFDEGITEGETDSSWERSSEGAAADLDEAGVPAAGQILQSSLMDTAVISLAGEGSSMATPYSRNTSIRHAVLRHEAFADDPICEQIKTELIRWRTQIDQIQLQDWISRKVRQNYSARYLSFKSFHLLGYRKKHVR